MFPARIPIISNPPTTEFANTYSIDLDGTDDYVDCGSDSSLRVSGDLTISCWIKTSTSQGAYLVSRDNAITRAYYLQQNGTSNRLQMRVQDGSGNNQYARGTTNIADGDWHHVVGVFDAGSTITLYVDGSSETISAGSADASGVSSLNTSALNPLIGTNKSSGGDFWDGLIDEVAIFSSVISVSDLRNGTSGQGNAIPANLSGMGNLVGWWRFEEGSGTSAADSSTNSNTGTLTNGPSYSTDISS